MFPGRRQPTVGPMNESSGPVLIAYDGSDHARAAVAAAGALLCEKPAGLEAEPRGLLHHAHRPVLVVAHER